MPCPDTVAVAPGVRARKRPNGSQCGLCCLVREVAAAKLPVQRRVKTGGRSVRAAVVTIFREAQRIV